MSALTLLKSNLEKDILEYSSKLIPFDKVFDEDVLDAKYEQLRIITDEIECLELQLMNSMIESNSLSSELSNKLEVFHKSEKHIQDDIRILLDEREKKYNCWKAEYIRNAGHFVEAQNKLKQIIEIENSLMNLTINNIKANNNVILLVYTHSQINKLLSLANIKKERSPYNAFNVAWYNQLIDDNIYETIKLK